MKKLLGLLVAVFCLLSISVIGLTLTGHLVVGMQQQMVNVVDDKDSSKVLFQMPTNQYYYRVIFVK